MSKPIDSFSVGSFQIALWENQAEGRTYKNVSVRKSFFNKKENKLDHQTLTLDPTELGCVAGLLRRMEEAVIQRRTEE